MSDTHRETMFLEAYDELADSVFRHCYLRVSPREEARDLTQECFTRVWDYMRKGHEINNMKAFVFRIANNLIIDWYRKKKTLRLDEEEALTVPDEHHAQSPEHDAIANETRVLLETLDEPYRTAVTLRYIEGFGPKDIAEILGETENVVSVRIHRGIKKLQEYLEENEKNYE